MANNEKSVQPVDVLAVMEDTRETATMKSTAEKLAAALRAALPQPLPDLSGHNDTESRRAAAEWARGWNAAMAFIADEARDALAEYDAQRPAEPDPLSPVATVYDAMGDRT